LKKFIIRMALPHKKSRQRVQKSNIFWSLALFSTIGFCMAKKVLILLATPLALLLEVSHQRWVVTFVLDQTHISIHKIYHENFELTIYTRYLLFLLVMKYFC
jgi:hypothetical protein